MRLSTNLPVDRIAERHLDKAEIRKVAVEPCGLPFARLLDRVDGKFDRDPARVADALAHPIRQHQVMPIARAQVTAGLGDADDRHRPRSEEHTSELQSLMRNSYAVFCLKKKN